MDEIILKIIEKQNITIKDSKIEIILKVINYHDPQINKRKFNDKYYLDFIMLMINDVVNWKSLTKLKKLEKSKYPNHYKSIYNKFNRWCKLDVFKQSYYILNKLHYKFNKSNCLDLYIDATYINNSKGVSNVDINPQYFKKRVTKLSALCDNELNIVSMIEIKSSLVHDINTVQDTINNINIDVKKKINIIGDKGYVNSRIFEHKNKVVNVIYPRKSN